MMISPNAYISLFKNSEYLDLIKERNQLIDFIQSYEKNEIAGDRSGEEWGIHPQPDVRYQMYLEYLWKICELMQKNITKIMCGVTEACKKTATKLWTTMVQSDDAAVMF